MEIFSTYGEQIRLQLGVDGKSVCFALAFLIFFLLLYLFSVSMYVHVYVPGVAFLSSPFSHSFFLCRENIAFEH